MKTITQIKTTTMALVFGLGGCGVTIEDVPRNPFAEEYPSFAGEYHAIGVSARTAGHLMYCDLSLKIEHNAKNVDVESILLTCPENFDFEIDEKLRFSLKEPKEKPYFVYDLFFNKKNSGFVATNNDELYIKFREGSDGFDLRMNQFDYDSHLYAFKIIVDEKSVLEVTDTKLIRK